MRSLGATRGAPNVAVVGATKAAMGMIREALGAEAIVPPASSSYDDASSEVKRLRASLCIVSFDEPELAIRLASELKNAHSQLRLVALANKGDANRIREAMRAGYSDYIVLPEDAEQLRLAAHEGAYGGGDDEERGEVVAICGSKGGAGVTSMAINLAAELCPVHRVLVADLNFSMGDVASFLDLKPSRNISDALRDLDRLDERVLAGTVAVHPSKVHVLAQPQEIADTEVTRGDDILRLLQVCSESYQYVLVDCGVGLEEATLTTMTVADMVFLVCNPDVPAIKNAWRRMQLFQRLGIEKGRIRLIVNKYDKKTAQLTLKDIEKHLDIRVAATIALDEKTLGQAVNDGRLVREVFKKSPAARDYSNMVTLITEGDEVVEVQEEKEGKMSWLFR